MENRFKVVYTGVLQPHISAQEAIRNVATMFKMPEDSVRPLVLGGHVQDVKLDIDRTTAERYVAALSKAGLLARIEPMARPKTELHLSPLTAEETISPAYRAAGEPCPKCGAHEVRNGICDACGVIAAKYLALLAPGQAQPPRGPSAEPLDKQHASPKAALGPQDAPPRPEILDGPHSVPTGHGWEWISRGFWHFKANPWTWVLVIVAYGVIFAAISLVPVMGMVAPYLLAPLFSAGLMLGAQAQDRGKPLVFQHLFAGFGQHSGQLLTAGVLYLVSIALATLPLVLAIGRPVFSATTGWDPGLQGDSGPIPTSALIPDIDPQMILLAGFVTALLAIPAVMAYWFAPTLIAIDGIKAWPAMKLSFMGCAKNISPFLIYGLAGTVLVFLGALPFLLGLLVVIPTLAASMYVAYRDVFFGRI
jgi:hypothetical protein